MNARCFLLMLCTFFQSGSLSQKLHVNDEVFLLDQEAKNDNWEDSLECKYPENTLKLMEWNLEVFKGQSVDINLVDSTVKVLKEIKVNMSVE